MKKRRWLFLCLFLLALALSIVTLLRQRLQSDRSVSYDYQADMDSVRGFSETLRVAGGGDFSPFSYLDENGRPCGHDVELAFAIARELGCKLEITLGDWTEMQAGLLNGTYDILITVDYSDERSRIMGYTSPVCLDSYVFFGKDSTLNLDDLSSLRKLRIAALDGGGATDNYLIPMGLLENTRFYDTQAAAFQSVADGESDLAIAGFIYGSNIIANMGLNLTQLGTPLYGTAYYFTYAIGNTTLGPRLNAALAALDSKGETRRIEEKWTVHYQPNLTLREYLARNRQNVLIFSLALFLILLAAVQFLFRRKRKREKTLLEHDQLTGLNHMHSFLSRVREILQRNPGRLYVLIRFDIDNFKAYNSTQGIEAGDTLLRKIGEGLRNEQRRRNDLLLPGYLGADHFVVLTLRDSEDSDPEPLYRCLSDLVKAAGSGYYLPVRMGLCAITEDMEDLQQVCDFALLALRSVKNDYYRHWAWFDEAMQNQMTAEKQITDRMFTALEENRFVPYFQPQYDYETGKICGAEALVRWLDPERGVIPPTEFVPLFEKNGFIYEMDQAIWRNTCRCIRLWKQNGLTPPPVSLNISRADIYHDTLTDTIQRITQEEAVSMAELRWEITESAYLENSSLMVDTVKKLHSLGAYVELDDFGSGYSSLASLKDVDFDSIKLDMSLLKNNSLSGKHAALLSSIVRLGRELGAELIAEGVEQPEQAAYLHELGCNTMQGYLYSPPLSEAEFAALLKKSIQKT